jgi:hypothetical protein
MGLTIKGGLQMKLSNDKKKLYKKCKNLIIENLIIENSEHFLTINENNIENNIENNFNDLNIENNNENLNNFSNIIDVDYSMDRKYSLFEQIMCSTTLILMENIFSTPHIKYLILKNVNDINKIEKICLVNETSYNLYPITNELFNIVIEL